MEVPMVEIMEAAVEETVEGEEGAETKNIARQQVKRAFIIYAYLPERITLAKANSRRHRKLWFKLKGCYQSSALIMIICNATGLICLLQSQSCGVKFH